MTAVFVRLGPDQRIFGIADHVLEDMDQVLLASFEVLVRNVAGFHGLHAIALGDIVVVFDDESELRHSPATLGIDVRDLHESHAKAYVRQCVKQAVHEVLT